MAEGKVGEEVDAAVGQVAVLSPWTLIDWAGWFGLLCRLKTAHVEPSGISYNSQVSPRQLHLLTHISVFYRTAMYFLCFEKDETKLPATTRADPLSYIRMILSTWR